jgi:hypothetical protein
MTKKSSTYGDLVPGDAIIAFTTSGTWLWFILSIDPADDDDTGALYKMFTYLVMCRKKSSSRGIGSMRVHAARWKLSYELSSGVILKGGR